MSAPVGVLLVAYHLLPRGAWDVSEDAPARPALLLPWATGSVASQLTVPSFFSGVGAAWTSWWAARQEDRSRPACPQRARQGHGDGQQGRDGQAHDRHGQTVRRRDHAAS